ncbi:MAG: S8 family serine peptidase, partial [Holophagales bacterium]|nr:S8 family serine peptidase [Holophagales bacterium]
MEFDFPERVSRRQSIQPARRPAWRRFPCIATGILTLALLAPGVSTAARDSNESRFRAAPAGSTPIEGRYLVVLEEGAVGSPAGLEASARGVRQLSEDLARGFDLRVDQVFSDALNAFVAEMGEAEARRLARHPFVATVQQDYSAKAISTDAPICKSSSIDPPNTRALPVPVFGTLFKQTITCPNASTNCIDNWGLDRIDEGGTTTDGKFTVNATGLGSYIFVLDTGINDHREWANLGGSSRVSSIMSRNFVSGHPNTPYTDWTGHGHGTHVAGIAGGRTYGVAKLANIVMLRVCDSGGNCAVSDIVNAMNFIAGIKGFFSSAVATRSANYSGWVGDTAFENAIHGLH